MASRRRIREILDSDDELPITYKDIAVTPAYKDDDRFSDKALHKLTLSGYDSCDSSSEMSSTEDTGIEYKHETSETKMNYRNFWKEGVMNRKDAYCIKVLESVYNDETLLWFINFTKSKDMQSHYSFLISCLAFGDEFSKSYSENRVNNCNGIRKGDKKIVFEYK